jgi:hypothetical protein
MPIVSAPLVNSSTNTSLSKKPQSIKDRLVQDGSAFSYSNGSTPPFNKLAGDGSTNRNYSLHYNPSTPDISNGYSVTGDNFSTINSYFQDYVDGQNNFLPEPTELDVDDPVTADPNYKPLYTPGTQTYVDKIPFLIQP